MCVSVHMCKLQREMTMEITLEFLLRILGLCLGSHFLEVKILIKCLTEIQVLSSKMQAGESVLIAHVVL